MKYISKNLSETLRKRFKVTKQLAVTAGVLALATASLMADVVYVTAAIQPSGTAANTDGQYTELHANPLSGTTAVSTAPGVPPHTAARFRALSGYTNGLPIVRLTPFLGTPGGVYQVDYTHNSANNNSTIDAIIGFTNAVGCTLSFSETTAFQRQFGQPAPQSWTFVGRLTNDPGVSTPAFELFLKDPGTNVLTLRLLIDCFRFTLVEPCLATPPVLVTGPLGTNSQTVTVSGVASNATAVRVYQNTGSGMVQIGSKTSDVTVSNNIVTVSGLVKNAQVAATQTIAGQEGCVPPTGTFVGGGANPSIGVAISINETIGTGPVGALGTGRGEIHFIGATGASVGAPVGALVLSPSTNWQTVTLGGRVSVANTANAVGTLTNGNTYSANNVVLLKVFPFKIVNATRIYSQTNGVAETSMTSNTDFAVIWRWDAVQGADGYRVERDAFGTGFVEYLEVTTNSLVDIDNSVWIFDGEQLPKVTGSQLSPSYQWNIPNGGVGSIGNTNGPSTAWGILESINFVIDSSDTGPFDIFIDELKNGNTVFQTFEEAANGATDYGFRIPNFSGTTSGNILTTPNVGRVTNLTAFAGVHSFNTKFQWSGTNSQRWLRMTTSGVGNPMVNLDDPISFKILLLPVGTVIEPPAQPPTIGHSLAGDQLTLTWTGTFNLQYKDSLNDAQWANVGVSNAPFTTNVVGAAKFFRLHNP